MNNLMLSPNANKYRQYCQNYIRLRLKSYKLRSKVQISLRLSARPRPTNGPNFNRNTILFKLVISELK